MNNPKILNNVRLIQKCIVVRKDGKILALKRAADDHSRGGCWDLPGGGYERGEDVIPAIMREVREEAGLIIHDPKPIFFTNRLGIKQGFFAGDTVFATTYVCKKWEGEVVISDEHTEFKWVTPEEFITFEFGTDDGYFVASIRAFTSLPR